MDIDGGANGKSGDERVGGVEEGEGRQVVGEANPRHHHPRHAEEVDTEEGDEHHRLDVDNTAPELEVERSLAERFSSAAESAVDSTRRVVRAIIVKVVAVGGEGTGGA